VCPPFSHICAAQVRGYDALGLVLFVVASLGELAFLVEMMRRQGEIDPIAGSQFVATAFLLIVNVVHCKKKAFAPQREILSKDKDLEHIGLTAVSYFRCVALDALSQAQEDLATRTTPLDPLQSIRGLKREFIEQCTKEAFTVHCLFGLLPVLGSALVSTKRNLERGERVLAMLALLSAYSKFAQIMILVQVAFVVRMAQVLSMFEIRRCEADIRTISPSLIHRITARFKSLLHECHMIGNTSHGVLVFYVSVVINVVQMITGVYAANFGAVSEEFEGSEDERPEEIAPAWVFFAVFVSGASAKERVLESEARSLVAPPPLFIRYDEHTLTLAWQQPMITLMIYLKSYGDLNLAIERDVDQVRNEREMRGRERMITPPPPFFTKCVGR